MGVFGRKSFVLAVFGIALAVYVNLPDTIDTSEHLEHWRTHRAFQTDFRGHKIFYKDEQGLNPDGPVLVLLHGFPTSSYDWSKVHPKLLKKVSRIVAPDYLGFGFSDKPLPFAYSIAVTADLVEHLLSSLGLPRVHLLAHDYGDTVGQELLARFNEREQTKKNGLVIQSLCLLNGGVFQETNFPRPLQKILLIPYVGPFLSHLSNFYIFRHGFSEIFGPDTRPDQEELKDFYGLIRHNNGHLAMVAVIKYLNDRDTYQDRWTGALRDTSVPLHVIYGPADPICRPAFIDLFKRVARNPSVSVLHGYIGHYPQWEDPSGVAREYSNFIDSL